jgi:gluconate kinase
LEPPTDDEHALTVSIDGSVEAIVEDILRQLALPSTERGRP